VPAKVVRKVMKHGSSGVVAIPMSYREYHDLNPGDDMIVLYNSLILMVPKEMEYVMAERKDLIDALLGAGRESGRDLGSETANMKEASLK